MVVHKLYKWSFNYLKKNFVKIIKYLIGGVVSFLLKLLITIFLVDLLHIDIKISYVISLIIVILFVFFYNFHITFQNKTSKKIKFFKYILAYSIFSGLDYILVIFINSLNIIDYRLLITCVTIFIMIIKYFAYNHLVFVRGAKNE